MARRASGWMAAAMAVLLAAAPAAGSLVRPLSMSALQASPAARTTVFFYDGDASALPVLEAMEAAAEEWAASPVPGASWGWASVDCNSEASRADCAAAGFAAGKQWVFTSSATDGIQAYNGDRSVDALLEAVRHKFLPAHPELVRPFAGDEHGFFERLDGGADADDDDDSTRGLPIFIKAHEQWCSVCKQVKNMFDQAAGYFLPRGVELWEVECSASTANKAFCDAHGVNSFPTLLLFDGERTVKYDQAERSIQAFDTFFRKELKGRYRPAGDALTATATRSATSEKEVEEAAATVKATKTATQPKASKQAKKSSGKKKKDKQAGAASPVPAPTPAPVSSPQSKKTKESKKAKSLSRRARREEEEEEEDEEARDEDESTDDDDEEEERRPRRRRSSSRSLRRRRARRSRDLEDEDEDDFADDEADELDEVSEDDDDEEDLPRRRRVARSSRNARRRSRRSVRSYRSRSRFDDDDEDEDDAERYDDEDDEDDEEEESPRSRRLRRQRRRQERQRRLERVENGQDKPTKSTKSGRKGAKKAARVHDEL